MGSSPGGLAGLILGRDRLPGRCAWSPIDPSAGRGQGSCGTAASSIAGTRSATAAQASASSSKASGSVLGRLAVELSDMSPPVVQSVMARLAFTPDLFNILIANGPAPPITLYSLGAPMRRIVPMVPIFSGQALSVAAMGYDGRVFFGLNADRDAVPDLDVMRAGIEETIHDLSRVTA